MRSLNSVEVSPYSLTCALILIGCAKQPLDCYPKASAYLLLQYLPFTLFAKHYFTPVTIHSVRRKIAKCRAAVRVSARGDPTPKRLHCLQVTSRCSFYTIFFKRKANLLNEFYLKCFSKSRLRLISPLGVLRRV